MYLHPHLSRLVGREKELDMLAQADQWRQTRQLGGRGPVRRGRLVVAAVLTWLRVVR
jgi:hypothetical protein